VQETHQDTKGITQGRHSHSKDHRGKDYPDKLGLQKKVGEKEALTNCRAQRKRKVRIIEKLSE